MTTCLCPDRDCAPRPVQLHGANRDLLSRYFDRCNATAAEDGWAATAVVAAAGTDVDVVDDVEYE